MTLQVNKDRFIHNGTEYHFVDVGYILYQTHMDRAIISMNEAHRYAVVTIQTIHTSALMLAYARWAFNRK